MALAGPEPSGMAQSASLPPPGGILSDKDVRRRGWGADVHPVQNNRRKQGQVRLARLRFFGGTALL